MAEPAGTNALHFPDAELMPGLVNCHTHLELTHLGGGAKHSEPEFLKWIRRVRELKDTTSAEAFHEAAVAGIRDCWARRPADLLSMPMLLCNKMLTRQSPVIWQLPKPCGCGRGVSICAPEATACAGSK